MFDRRSWLAAIGGTVVGAVTLLLLQSVPLIALIPFPLAGITTVACHRFALRRHGSAVGGALLGLQTGLLMSVVVVIWTMIVTGVDHYEFAFAVFYMPFLICILCILGAWVTAFFVARPS